MSESVCDNKSVGVILEYQEKLLLIERAKFPLGIAAVAGHVDGFASYEEAAVTEVFEEVGITIAQSDLRLVIPEHRVDNRCRRTGGDFHSWVVFWAQSPTDVISRSLSETNMARWYGRGELQELSELSKGSQLPENKRLENVWSDFFIRAGIITE